MYRLLILLLIISITSYSQETEKVHTRVDVAVDFIGGAGEYLEFLNAQLKMPIELYEKGTSGKVFVQFVIDTVGEVSDVKIMKDIGFGSGVEAERFIKSTSGKWNPALIKGRKVKSQIVYPIKFIVGEVIEDYLIEKEQVEKYRNALKLMKSENYNEAIILFDEILIKVQDNKGSFFNRGMCYLKINNRGMACNDWKRAKYFGDKKIESYLLKNCEK